MGHVMFFYSAASLKNLHLPKPLTFNYPPTLNPPTRSSSAEAKNMADDGVLANVFKKPVMKYGR